MKVAGSSFREEIKVGDNFFKPWGGIITHGLPGGKRKGEGRRERTFCGRGTLAGHVPAAMPTHRLLSTPIVGTLYATT